MANTAQARKRARQAVTRNAHNSSQRSTLRTAIKNARKAIADKKIIHKNKAARHKSRLAAALKALSA